MEFDIFAEMECPGFTISAEIPCVGNFTDEFTLGVGSDNRVINRPAPGGFIESWVGSFRAEVRDGYSNRSPGSGGNG